MNCSAVVVNYLLIYIQLYKTKNLMTLTIDGRSNLNIMKKGKKTDTNTNDLLYLGGITKGTRSRGLETTG